MIATVGSQFTTAKSGVTGTIQEIVKNDNGSYRVRLDVDGQSRWTTVLTTSQLLGALHHGRPRELWNQAG